MADQGSASSAVDVPNETGLAAANAPAEHWHTTLFANAPAMLHAAALLSMMVLFNWINFGPSAEVGVATIDVGSGSTSGLKFEIDISDFYDWYSECLGAARGAFLCSWTGVAVLLTFAILYLVSAAQKMCCKHEPWSPSTTRILYASCSALQLAAIICFRVGYAVVRADVHAACCQRTDFSAVGALRTTQKDSQHETIWDTYCTMTSCACSWDSAAEPGGKLITGAFFWASVAAWALSVLAIAYQQITLWRAESSAGPSGAGTEMAAKTTTTAWKATE